MQNVEKKSISFKSADHRTKIKAYFYASTKVKPFCVLQISHGMCEFIQRYEEFAIFMANHGVVVCGNDHLGHGDSIVAKEDWGFFSEKNGRKFLLKDLHIMNEIAHKEYLDLPIILLGHSMGSFLARQYAITWPQTIQGLIISGTGGPNPLVNMGIVLADVVEKVKGPRYRSKAVNAIAFGQYLKQIENPNTEYDWLSADKEIVDIYKKDERCTFIFTVNGFRELFSSLKDVSSTEWAEKLPKQMPIFIFSGGQDPVGDYGKGVEIVYDWIKDQNVEDVELKIYPEGRHEMLNEVNRKEVYQDVLNFLEKNWKLAKTDAH